MNSMNAEHEIAGLVNPQQTYETHFSRFAHVHEKFCGNESIVAHTLSCTQKIVEVTMEVLLMRRLGYTVCSIYINI